MIEIEEALLILKKNLEGISESEECPLSECFSRVLYEDLYAPMNVPPFAKSAMDGYAVRSCDVEKATKENPVQLAVEEELFAGEWKNISYRKNSSVRVMTGSPIPAGFDAVVKQEDTDCGEKSVLVYNSVSAGQNYCAVGEDIKKGSLILKSGTKIARVEIGLLSSMGFKSVKVKRKARVAILSTGSELCEAGNPLSNGKIYSSIDEMLCVSVKNAGFLVSEKKILLDDEKIISSEIQKAEKSSDFIITTGGISVGKKDLLPKVLKSLGAETLFSGVNIQPGTPTCVSVLNKKIILSLSGNPYAALVNFDIYFYYAASVLMQCDSLLPKKIKATLTDDYSKKNHLRRFVRAFFDGERVFFPSSLHASSVISNLCECNCYVDVPVGKTLKKGSKVQIWLMG